MRMMVSDICAGARVMNTDIKRGSIPISQSMCKALHQLATLIFTKLRRQKDKPFACQSRIASQPGVLGRVP
jgi:hypothetical protein